MPRRPAYPRTVVAEFIRLAREHPENRPIPQGSPAYYVTARPELTAADGAREDALPTHTPTPEED